MTESLRIEIPDQGTITIGIEKDKRLPSRESLFPLTQRKLQRTRCLLDFVDSSQEHMQLFLTFLDAFVQMARTVTFVLQKEGKDIRGFKEWYTQKQTEMKDNKVFEFFKNARNITAKEGIIDHRIALKIEIRGIPPGFKGRAVTLKYTGDTFDLVPGQSLPDVGTKIAYFFPRWDQDIVTICRQYVEQLTAIVEEGERILADKD